MSCKIERARTANAAGFIPMLLPDRRIRFQTLKGVPVRKKGLPFC